MAVSMQAQMRWSLFRVVNGEWIGILVDIFIHTFFLSIEGERDIP